MRRRILWLAFGAAVFITMVSFGLRFGLEPAEHPRRQASDLALSFLAYSNGMAVVEVGNRGTQKVQLAYGYIEIEVRDLTNGSVSFSGDAYRVSGSDVLSAGALFHDSFPAPTNRACWRATLAAFDGRELERKQAVEASWLWQHRPLWVLRQYPKLSLVHADTEWIGP